MTNNIIRRVAVMTLTVTLLAATPVRAAVGQGRPELREAMQAFVDVGFAGMQLRVHDQRGDWVGSAGVRRLGEAELASALAGNLLANHEHLAMPTGFRLPPDAATRYGLINHHREDQTTWARLNALVEARLRSAGVPIPYQ